MSLCLNTGRIQIEERPTFLIPWFRHGGHCSFRCGLELLTLLERTGHSCPSSTGARGSMTNNDVGWLLKIPIFQTSSRKNPSQLSFSKVKGSTGSRLHLYQSMDLVTPGSSCPDMFGHDLFDPSCIPHLVDKSNQILFPTILETKRWAPKLPNEWPSRQAPFCLFAAFSDRSGRNDPQQHRSQYQKEGHGGSNQQIWPQIFSFFAAFPYFLHLGSSFMTSL